MKTIVLSLLGFGLCMVAYTAYDRTYGRTINISKVSAEGDDEFKSLLIEAFKKEGFELSRTHGRPADAYIHFVTAPDKQGFTEVIGHTDGHLISGNPVPVRAQAGIIISDKNFPLCIMNEDTDIYSLLEGDQRARRTTKNNLAVHFVKEVDRLWNSAEGLAGCFVH